MNCKNVHQHLPDYSLGFLREEERAAVEHHLAVCDKCRLLAERSRAFNELIDAEKSISAGPFFYTRLEQRMKERPKPGTVLHPALSYALTGLMVVFLLVSLSAGILTGRLADKKGITAKAAVVEEYTLGNDYFLNDSSQFELENILLSDLN
jgi:anti-sigma factor RsiW